MIYQKPIISWDAGVFWCGRPFDRREMITAEVKYINYLGEKLQRRLYVFKWVNQGYRNLDQSIDNMIDQTYQFILDSKPEDYVIRFDENHVKRAEKSVIPDIRNANSPEHLNTSILDTLPDENYLWVHKIKALDQLKYEKEDPKKWPYIHALINADSADEVQSKLKECLKNGC